MSDIEIVLSALPRVQLACRGRPVDGPGAGLTEKQIRILGQLHDEDPSMVTELADHLGVTPSTMSLNLGRLERAGLVRRERDPDDRRVANVLLTSSGRAARDATRALDPGRVHDMLHLLSPSKRERAVEGLTILSAAADTLVARRREEVDAQTGGER